VCVPFLVIVAVVCRTADVISSDRVRFDGRRKNLVRSTGVVLGHKWWIWVASSRESYSFTLLNDLIHNRRRLCVVSNFNLAERISSGHVVAA